MTASRLRATTWPARAVVVVLATLVTAWFANGIIQAHDTAAATSALSRPGKLTTARATKVRALLNRAGSLNPDQQVKLLEAELRGQLGYRAQAEQMISRIVAAEPKNVAAWILLLHYAQNRRDNLFALGGIVSLMPHVPPAH